VELSVPADDISFDEVVELFRNAALAWGYHQKTVSDYFSEE